MLQYESITGFFSISEDGKLIHTDEPPDDIDFWIIDYYNSSAIDFFKLLKELYKNGLSYDESIKLIKQYELTKFILGCYDKLKM